MRVDHFMVALVDLTTARTLTFHVAELPASQLASKDQ